MGKGRRTFGSLSIRESESRLVDVCSSNKCTQHTDSCYRNAEKGMALQSKLEWRSTNDEEAAWRKCRLKSQRPDLCRSAFTCLFGVHGSRIHDPRTIHD